jgi:hypothetical protein
VGGALLPRAGDGAKLGNQGMKMYTHAEVRGFWIVLRAKENARN